MGLRMWLCGLTGHDLVRHFEPNRMALRCASCPYETPGWELRTPPVRNQGQGAVNTGHTPNRAVLALIYVQKNTKRLGLAFGRPALGEK